MTSHTQTLLAPRDARAPHAVRERVLREGAATLVALERDAELAHERVNVALVLRARARDSGVAASVVVVADVDEQEHLGQRDDRVLARARGFKEPA